MPLEMENMQREQPTMHMAWDASLSSDSKSSSSMPVKVQWKSCVQMSLEMKISQSVVCHKIQCDHAT